MVIVTIFRHLLNFLIQDRSAFLAFSCISRIRCPDFLRQERRYFFLGLPSVCGSTRDYRRTGKKKSSTRHFIMDWTLDASRQNLASEVLRQQVCVRPDFFSVLECLFCPRHSPFRVFWSFARQGFHRAACRKIIVPCPQGGEDSGGV